MSKQTIRPESRGKRKKSYLKLQVEAAVDFLLSHGVFESEEIANHNIKSIAKKRYNSQQIKQ